MNPVSYALTELGPPHNFELSVGQGRGHVSLMDEAPSELAHRHCFPSCIPEYLKEKEK